MSDDITGLCKDHSFESAEAVCRRCGLEFCELCLVYPFGAGRPLCKECAMAEGGVRSHVARAPMGRRDLRKKLKAFDRQQAARLAASGNGNGNGEGMGNVIRSTEPVLRDPLVPTDDDLEPVPAAPAPPPVEETAAASFDAPPPPPPPPPAPTQEPAEGVAPPIDWSQPFG